MTGARVLTHLPLVRIEGPRAELGGGALFALPFAEYDELLDGSFTDARREYESTAPVFFLTEHAADAPDFARHLTGLARAHDALALAAPSAAIPDAGVSLRILDIAGEPPVTQTQQGDADQELLFLGRMAAYALSAAELERATELLEVVDRCHGELRWALDELHAAATLSLTRAERLTLCTIALEALLLPELDTQLKATFARRLAHLVGGEDAEALARAIYDARSEAVHGEAGVEAAPGAAERLLAAAVVGLERLTRDGTGLAEIRTRLDEEPAAPPQQPPPLPAPAPGSRVLRAPPRRALPVYSGHT